MFRRSGIISMLALTSYLFCGMAAPQTCNQSSKGPSIVGPAIGVGAVVAAAVIIPVAIVHSHHTIKGCASTGADGLQVQDPETLKTYKLTGITTGVKEGDLVRLHGQKVKGPKDDKDNRSFVVAKVSKDYGLCSAQPKPGAM